MRKTAFIFPGQGAQYVGMGQDFYKSFSVCRQVFDIASEASGLDIAKLCFEENEQLNQTEYTQICMLAVEAAILKAVEQQGVASDVNAGLSLGEYGALAASGAMELDDAFRVVRRRGILMQEAVPSGGAMAAVLALDAAVIEEVCQGINGIVSIANYNCDHRRRGSSGSRVQGAEGSRCKADCETEGKRAVPFPDACRSGREAGRGPCRGEAEGIRYSLYYKCDCRLCDIHRGDKGFAVQAGSLRRPLAAVYGADACRRRGYLY